MMLKKRGTKYLTILLIATLLVTSTTLSWGASEKSTPTVCFTASEADSILTSIDRLRLSIQMQRITLTEQEQRIQGQEFQISQLKSKIDPWYKKILKHPALWFCIGAYAGMKAAE